MKTNMETKRLRDATDIISPENGTEYMVRYYHTSDKTKQVYEITGTGEYLISFFKDKPDALIIERNRVQVTNLTRLAGFLANRFILSQEEVMVALTHYLESQDLEIKKKGTPK